MRVVTRAGNSCFDASKTDGHFFANLTAEQHQLYTQAMCTIAICELYGMTRDEDVSTNRRRRRSTTA